jgi:hypothetical protein
MAGFLTHLRSKLPTRQEVWPVYSILLFLSASWGLYRGFFYTPSWLEYLSVWSILIIFTYVLAHSLVESFIMLIVPLAFTLVFPARRFKQQFVAQASVQALALGAGALLLQRQVSILYKLETWQIILFPLLALAALVVLALALSVLFGSYPGLQRLVQTFAERMTVFGLLYGSLGLASLLVVLARNIF